MNRHKRLLSLSAFVALLVLGWFLLYPGFVPQPGRARAGASVSGTLANGLRYAVADRGQHGPGVSLLLKVRAGSADENDRQQGAASFLPHMAFSGTAHSRPGEMVDRVKRLQPDFNPHSDFLVGSDETLYRLELPDGKPETLAEGLGILANWAGGMSLAPAEIERQKGTVETLARRADTPEHRILEQLGKLRYAGTAMADRPAQVSAERIASLDQAALKGFYETWYRPEAMTVAVVGDVDPEVAAGQIRKRFASLKDRSPAPLPGPGALILNTEPVLLIVHEPKAIGTDIWVEKTMANASAPGDSERGRLERQFAEEIFTRRIEEIVARRSDSRVANAGMFFVDEHGFADAGLHVSARENGQGLAALRLGMEEYRRMLEFGPTDAELAAERSKMEADLDEAVREEKARSNAQIAAGIVEGRSLQSPEQRRALLKPMLATMERGDIVSAMRAFSDRPGRETVALTGREDLGGDAESILRGALEAARSAKIAPLPDDRANTWAYGNLADPDGTQWMKERRDEAALGIHVLWSHTNGLRMQVHPNQNRRGEVLASLRFDIGSGAKTEDRPVGVGELIERGLVAGGLGKHTAAEVEAMFGRSSVRFRGVQVSDDAITYTAECKPADLSRALQLLRAYSGDPGWRSEAEQPVKQTWLDSLAAAEHDPAAQAKRLMEKELAGAYAWRRPANPAEVKALTFADARRWLDRALDNATLTVSVSGDVGEDALQTVALWFGQYRVHAHFMMASIADARASAIAPVQIVPEVKRIAVDSAKHEAVLELAWLTDDVFDLQRVMSLEELAVCLQERLKSRLGVSSVRVWNVASDSIRGSGEIRAEVVVKAGRADAALALIRDEASKTGANGATKTMVDHANVSLLATLRHDQKGNAWWIETALPYASWQPFRIRWAAEAERNLESVEAKDVDAVASRYLRDEGLVGVVAVSR